MKLSTDISVFKETSKAVVPHLELNSGDVKKVFPDYSPSDVKSAFRSVEKLLDTVASTKKKKKHRHAVSNLAEVGLVRHLGAVNTIGGDIINGNFSSVANMFEHLVEVHRRSLYIVQTGERFDDDALAKTTTEVRDALTAMDDFSEFASNAKTQLADYNAACAAIERRVEDAVQGKQAELDGVFAEATKNLQVIKEQTASANTLGEQLTDQKAALIEQFEAFEEGIAEKLQGAEESANRVAELEADAKKHTDATESLESKLLEREEALNKQQDSATKIEESLKVLRQKVEELLPGATSAGLARSYRQRKETYRRPRLAWIAMFLLSLLAIAGINYWAITDVKEEVGLLMSLLARLPITVPLVVVVWFSGIRIKETARLEEEYAFKEARAASYEGYRREAEDFDGRASTELGAQLLQGTLHDIARHPISIMHVKQGELSPLPHFMNEATSLVSVANGHPKRSSKDDNADFDAGHSEEPDEDVVATSQAKAL